MEDCKENVDLTLTLSVFAFEWQVKTKGCQNY